MIDEQKGDREARALQPGSQRSPLLVATERRQRPLPRLCVCSRLWLMPYPK